MHTIQSNEPNIEQTDRLFGILPDASGRGKLTEIIKENNGELELITLGRSILSRPIEAMKIGKGEKKICIFASHHAMENITVNIAFLIGLYLSKPALSASLQSANIPLILNKYTYYVVPCVNPDGVELYFHGADENLLRERQIRMSGGDFSSWQANARGVDLNYNYGYRFEERKAYENERGIKAGKEMYAGQYEESEPECRSVANFIRLINPYAVVSLGADGDGLYYAPKEACTERIATRIVKATACGFNTARDTEDYAGLYNYTGALGIPSFDLKVGKSKFPLSKADVRRVADVVARGIILLPTYL